MEKKFLTIFAFSLLFQACGQNTSQPSQKETIHATSENQVQIQRQDPSGNMIQTRFNTPKDFQRVVIDTNSFAAHLRALPLKSIGSEVSYYNGQTKPNRNVYDAVVDLPIGKRDLHQCADAVIRLRAEYLFNAKKYDSIHFNFTNGFKADYTNWRKGKRIIVDGNTVFWKQKTQVSDSPKDFWKYLEMVFSYAGTASLSNEMQSISTENIQIGDVFVQGGFPGHAVIVVDMAIHTTTGEKLFLLAQSFMPAQEIQILKNPNDGNLSPWYNSNIVNELRTPEWSFKQTDLKRFVN